jgi:8-oxo-dGTP pyrophosphatase MutT (NUDIX family)
MKLGAGFILLCPPTGRILLALRTDHEAVWANFGGSVEKYETSLQAAKREMAEEAGFMEGHHYDIVGKRPINISKYRNFAYRCYLAVCETEILPTLNYEHSEYRWVALDELPENLHFGMVNIMSDAKVINKLNTMGINHEQRETSTIK